MSDVDWGTGWKPKSPNVQPPAPAAPAAKGDWGEGWHAKAMPAAKEPVGTAEDIGRGALAGVVRGGQGLAELPTSGLSLVNRGIGWGAEKLGATEVAKRARKQAEDLAAMSGQIQRGTDMATLGLGKYEPQTTGGKIAEKVGEFAPGFALPGVGMTSRLAEGVVGKVAGQAIGRGVENVAAPMVGSQVGEQVGEAIGHPQAGQVIGGVLGGGAGSLRGPRIDPATVEAAGRQGVRIPVSGALEMPGVQQAGKVLEKVPFAGEPLQSSAQRAIEDFQRAKAGVEPSATTPASAGANVKEGVSNWFDAERGKVKDAYDTAGKVMNPNASVNPDALQSAVANITARRIASKATDENGPAVNMVRNAIKGPMTFEGLKDLRTRVGQTLKTSILPPEWNQGELKEIYGALREDLTNSAEAAGGPQGKALWQRADQLAKESGDRRRAVAKLVGVQGDAKPELVFSRLQGAAQAGGRGNIAMLKQAHDILGRPEWEELSHTIGAQMGRDPTSGEVTMQRFLTNYNKMSEEGKRTLFAPDMRSAYDDLAQLSKRENVLRKFANPSGTGQYGAAATALGGLWFEPHATIGALTVGNAMAHILSAPATAKSFSRFVRAAQDDAAAARTGAAVKTGVTLSNAARNLSNTYNSQTGEKTTPEQFTQALGGQGGGQQGSGNEPFRVQVPYHVRSSP